MKPLAATVRPLDDPSQLEAEWRALHERSGRSFFLSWTWMSTWLAGLDAPPWLVRVCEPGGAPVALGLLCEGEERRHKVVRVRQLRLHETGVASRDAVCIEHNTLLCEPGMEAAAWRAALAALTGPDAPAWDELLVSGASAASTPALEALGLAMVKRAEGEAAHVDLAALRAQGVTDREGWLATLGKSTRQSLRRAIRLYEARGTLALEAARTRDEARTFMAECGVLHEAKWRALGRQGAFSNPDYLAFHDALIERALPLGEVELLRASAGGAPFGYLYNFTQGDAVLFYLSGFAFEADNRMKPGLVTHALAVERHLGRGAAIYDFMGGTNRYKTNLGVPGNAIVAWSLQRRRPKLLLEAGARRLKAALGRG